MTDDHDYDLVMPFLPTASRGGPHDDHAYAAGWEMGTLYAHLERQESAVHKQPIHAENAQQSDLVAMRNGYRCDITPLTDEWCWATFTKTEEPGR